MAVPFNTHEVVQDLEDLGFPRPQAEGLTTVLLKTAQGAQEQLATKLDMAEVKTEIAEVRTEMAQLRTELKGDIAQVRTDMEKMRGELRTEIREAKNSALTWTIGVLGTLYVLGFGLLYTLIQRGFKP
jgi:hypothetical protein